MQPTELTAEQLDLMRSDASAFREAWYARHIFALLSHADALQAKVTRLEGEHKRRRVDDELPEDRQIVVLGRDDNEGAYGMHIATWDEGGELWERADIGSYARRSSYDWWAPIAPEEAE